MYQQWLKDEDGNIMRKSLCGTVDDVLLILKKKLPSFLQHTYINAEQSSHFENLKKNLLPSEVCVQVDFSENYTFQHQDQIQSTHWVSHSCTLYAAIIYFSTGNGNVQHQSYVIVSDYMHHDKFTVAHFNSLLLRDFRTQHPEIMITHVHFQSDGTAQHFKQK